jgi:Holliday junction resolvase-like predicted endonuclease
LSELAVKKYLEDQGHRFLQHRFKTPFAEIDLLFQEKPKRWWLVEVKSVKEGFDEKPVSDRQLRRLSRAADFLAEKYNVEVLIKLASVEKQKQIEIFELEKNF